MDYSYWKMTTPPVIEPLHKTEVKNHLRVSGSGDDSLIEALIRTAREYCENYQGRAYIVRTCELGYDDSFPEVFYIPYPPLVSITSVSPVITYLASSTGTETTLTSTYYTVDNKSEPGRIYAAYGQYYPTIRAIRNTVKVTYIAGYAAKITTDKVSDIVTVLGRTFADADIVRIYNSGGAIATPLAADTDYHVRDTTGSTFKLAATAGGAAIDITGDATGNNYIQEPDRLLPENVKSAIMLIVGHLYEHREETMERRLNTIPLGAKMLLQQERVNW